MTEQGGAACEEDLDGQGTTTAFSLWSTFAVETPRMVEN